MKKYAYCIIILAVFLGHPHEVVHNAILHKAIKMTIRSVLIRRWWLPHIRIILQFLDRWQKWIIFQGCTRFRVLFSILVGRGKLLIMVDASNSQLAHFTRTSLEFTSIPLPIIEVMDFAFMLEKVIFEVKSPCAAWLRTLVCFVISNARSSLPPSTQLLESKYKHHRLDAVPIGTEKVHVYRKQQVYTPRGK